MASSRSAPPLQQGRRLLLRQADHLRQRPRNDMVVCIRQQKIRASGLPSAPLLVADIRKKRLLNAEDDDRVAIFHMPPVDDTMRDMKQIVRLVHQRYGIGRRKIMRGVGGGHLAVHGCAVPAVQPGAAGRGSQQLVIGGIGAVLKQHRNSAQIRLGKDLFLYFTPKLVTAERHILTGGQLVDQLYNSIVCIDLVEQVLIGCKGSVQRLFHLLEIEACLLVHVFPDHGCGLPVAEPLADGEGNERDKAHKRNELGAQARRCKMHIASRYMPHNAGVV